MPQEPVGQLIDDRWAGCLFLHLGVSAKAAKTTIQAPAIRTTKPAPAATL